MRWILLQEVMMPKVIIDGVEYVPKAEIPPITDERLQKALESLTEIQYFSDCSHKHRAWAFDALLALVPELADLSADSPNAAYDRVRGVGQGGDFNPNWVSPPGDTLRDLLEERGMTPHDLSVKADIDEAVIASILSGCCFSRAYGVELERAGFGTADFWERRNNQYRELGNRNADARAKRIEAALSSLLAVINSDKDGSYFICAEAKDVIEEANLSLAKTEDLRIPE
jgi:plasmid maintenance system antidote protein VapI